MRPVFEKVRGPAAATQAARPLLRRAGRLRSPLLGPGQSLGSFVPSLVMTLWFEYSLRAGRPMLPLAFT